jgi:hypothetical protein
VKLATVVRPQTPARGLATLALLKTNFDMRQDHIGMFMPFVLDAIGHLSSADFSGLDVATELRSRHGLTIPDHTLSVLLHRAVKKHGVRRQAGRYFRTNQFAVEVNISQKRQEFEQEQTIVAASLQSFAEKKGLEGLSQDEALALLFSFLDENHVLLALDGSPGSSPLQVEGAGKPLGERETRIVAQFVLEQLKSNQQIAHCLKGMLEGFILQNALFLRDIGQAEKKFSNLTVFLDSAIILEIIGLEGEVAASATREGLALLRDMGAHLAVFEKTLAEVSRILRVYEEHLGSTAGIASLYPTEVTRYVVSHHLSPADMRQASSLLRLDLDAIGIKVRESPQRNPHYTLDEKDLTNRIRRPGDTDLHPRVTHDVDAIAAVLTLRGDGAPTRLDDGIAVFATRTGLLVKNVREWFVAQGHTELPPAIHRIALSSAAWLKRPAAAPDLKIHELAALCAAALAPSKRVWDRFLAHLRSLRASGTISSEEMVAVVASQLTDNLLSEIDDEIEADAQTIEEIIHRVQDEYRTHEETKTKQMADEFAEKLRLADTDKLAAEAKTLSETDRRRQLELRITRKASTWAKRISWILFILGALLLALGSTEVVERFFENRAFLSHLIAVTTLLVVWIVGIVTTIWGGDFVTWREWLARSIEKRLRDYFGLSNEDN